MASGGARTGGAVVDEMLDLGLKNPVNLRATGEGAAALAAPDVVTAGVFAGVSGVDQSLNPQREAAPLWAVAGATLGLVAARMLDRAVCSPTLLSAMNVRRARTQLSEASRASCASLSSCLVSSSCSFILSSSLRSESISRFSSDGTSGSCAEPQPNIPDIRLDCADASGGLRAACEGSGEGKPGEDGQLPPSTNAGAVAIPGSESDTIRRWPGRTGLPVSGVKEARFDIGGGFIAVAPGCERSTERLPIWLLRLLSVCRRIKARLGVTVISS